jgi:hypothetical protein
MHRRATTAILMTITGTVLAGSLTATAVALEGGSDVSKAAVDSVAAANRHLAPSEQSSSAKDTGKDTGKDKRISAETSKKKTTKKKAKKKLPSGRSTATSFWDTQTASGKPMAYHTLASPYWPLGTKVKITYQGKSAMGVVEDFGPAEWAVKQHDPPAIVDLSEKMMDRLTGSRDNSVTVKFQVEKFGHGPKYVHSGTGYKLAMGKK